MEISLKTVGEFVASGIAAFRDGNKFLDTLKTNQFDVIQVPSVYSQMASIMGLTATSLQLFASKAGPMAQQIGIAGLTVNMFALSSNLAQYGIAIQNINDPNPSVAEQARADAITSMIGALAAAAGLAASFDTCLATVGFAASFPFAAPLVIIATSAQLVYEERASFSWAADEIWNAFKEALNESNLTVDIPSSANDLYLSAIQWVHPRDPLVLDLDGDGIEATAIDPLNAILFDHNADGIRAATGWISADDGIVVMDRDGNGTIDTGRELFGDNTLLANGSKAANGFAALADLDLNGDHKIDASDTAYTSLRIWQDVNQNGYSEASELKTLAELGIASISVVGAESNIDLGNGNTMPLTATFTRTDGTTGTSGTPDVSGSLLLAANNFYREFTDDPEVTEAAAALPQMGGSGLVRSSLDLQADVTRYFPGNDKGIFAMITYLTRTAASNELIGASA